MIVKENICFKRGLDPKKALEVGFYAEKFNPSVEDLLLYPIGTKLVLKKKIVDGEKTTFDYLIYEIVDNNPCSIKIRTHEYWEGSEEAALTQFNINNSVEYYDLFSILFTRGRVYSMRAFKDVNESVSFQRGLDPKQALEVGFYAEKFNPSAEDLKMYPEGTYVIIKRISKYANYLLCRIRRNDDSFSVKVAPRWLETREKAASYSNNYLATTWNMDSIVNIFNNYDEIHSIQAIKRSALDESVSFQRGLDPKQALGVGLYTEKFNPSIEDFMIYPVGTKILIKRASDHNKYLLSEVLENDGENISIKIGHYWEKTLQGAIISFKGTNHNDSSFTWGKDRIIERLSRSITGVISSIQAIKGVNESIAFQRGLDPKKALGVGLYAERLNPSYEDLLMYPVGTYFIIRRDSQYGYLLGKIERNDDNYPFDYPFSVKVTSRWLETREQAISSMKYPLLTTWYRDSIVDLFNSYEKIHSIQGIRLNESLDFQRGLDPKKALGVGLYAEKFNPSVEDLLLYPAGSYILFKRDWEVAAYLVCQVTQNKGNGDFKLKVPTGWQDYKDLDKWIKEINSYDHFIWNKKEVGERILWSDADVISVKALEDVNESVSFKRGIDPKAALGIGIYAEFPDPDFEYILDFPKDTPFLIKRERGYRYPFCICKTFINDRGEFRLTLSNEFSETTEIAIEVWNDDSKEKLSLGKVDTLRYFFEYDSLRNNYIEYMRALGIGELNESISFQRGLDPKQALGVGLYAERLNPSYEDLLMYPVGTTLIFHRPSDITPFLVGKIIENDEKDFKIEIGMLWTQTKDEAITSYKNRKLNSPITISQEGIRLEFFQFESWFSQEGLKSVQAIKI